MHVGPVLLSNHIQAHQWAMGTTMVGMVVGGVVMWPCCHTMGVVSTAAATIGVGVGGQSATGNGQWVTGDSMVGMVVGGVVMWPCHHAMGAISTATAATSMGNGA